MKQIQHDKDGFLLPKKDTQNIEQILENTETLLQRHKIIMKKPQAVYVNVGKNTPIQSQPKTQKATKTVSGSLKTTQTANSRPNFVQKREQQDRTAAIRQAKVQTELLEEIAKNSKPKRGKGLMGNFLKGLGLLGGLLKGLSKLPLNLAKGAFRGGKGALLSSRGGKRGANGRFIPKGATNAAKGAGFLGKLGKIGKLGKGILKGGAFAALFGLLDGIDVENSDLSRPEKNKKHAKNFAIGAGGLGGAAVGAAIGSVVPVVGTVVGGILGGFGGAALMEHWIEWLDNRIPKNFSNRMFGSWDGFVGTIKDLWRGFTANAQTAWQSFSGSLTTMASAVWQTLIPQSVQTYFSDLGKWSKSAWDGVATGAAAFWESAKEIARSAFNAVSDVAQSVKQGAENAYNAVKETWNGSSIGQAVNGAVDKIQQGAASVGNNIKNGALNFLGYDMTKKYDHLGYGMGKKGLNGGSIDCSGWSFQVTKMEMENLNSMLGFEKYKIKGNQAGILNVGMHNAATQIGLVSQQNGVVTDTRTGFDRSKLKAGMMIGQMKRSANYQGAVSNVKGYGKTQYNHIVKVVRGKDGKLYISESQGGGGKTGVTLTKIDDWLNMRIKRGDTLTAVNPFGDDIDLLNGSVGAIAKNEVRKGADFVTEKATQGVKSVRDWVLGHTSSKYETGGRGAGVISSGNGDKGGVSYGSYQMSSKMGVVQDFVKKSPYTQHFAGLAVNSEAFKQKWRDLAKNDPNFAKAQHDYIEKTHYLPQINKLKGKGIDLSQRGAGVQDAVWSTAVQFGGGTNLIINALKGKNAATLSDREIIETIQDYKIKNNNTLFKSSDSKNRAGTLRRAELEKADLLRLVATPANQVAVLPTAPKVPMPIVSPKPVAAQPVITHPAPPPKKAAQNDYVGVSVFGGGTIAHKPVARTVAHSQIAHMASGGIMDKQQS